MGPSFALDNLLRRYGKRRKKLEPVYTDMLEEAKQLATPRGLRRTFSGGELPQLAAYLPGAEAITLGVCTLGPELEDRVSTLFKTDALSAVVLDEIGTRWIKEVARDMHLEIRTAARETGKQAGPSFRPGIGHWPLDLQGPLLASLSADTIGVRYQDGLMLPQKTISMIVAAGTSLRRSHFAPQKTAKSPDDWEGILKIT